MSRDIRTVKKGFKTMRYGSEERQCAWTMPVRSGGGGRARIGDQTMKQGMMGRDEENVARGRAKRKYAHMESGSRENQGGQAEDRS